MAQLDEVLQTHVVEVRGDDVVDLVRVELAVRVHLPRVLAEGRAVQFLGARPGGHDLGRVRQIGEHERRGQHVDRVILPTVTRVEQARQHVGALEVEVVPHALAQQRPRVRLPFEIRGVAEEVRQDRADDGAEAHLVDGVALVHIVDADLGGGGAAHHAGAELANAAEVVGHRIVAVLGVDRHIGEAGLGLIPVVDQTEIEVVENRIEFAAEFRIQRVQVGRLFKDADGGLHLPARLQRDGDARAAEAHQMPVLPVLLLLVVVRGEALEQRFDAVGLVIRHGGVVAVVHRKMLDLHAEPTGAALRTPVLEEPDQAFDVLGIRLGQQMGVTDARCCHAPKHIG